MESIPESTIGLTRQMGRNYGAAQVRSDNHVHLVESRFRTACHLMSCHIAGTIREATLLGRLALISHWINADVFVSGSRNQVSLVAKGPTLQCAVTRDR